MITNYARAFGFLEAAVHRALRELEDSDYPVGRVHEARAILREALRDL